MPSHFENINENQFSITLTTENFHTKYSQCSREEKHSGMTWYIHVRRNESNDLLVGIGWKTKANSSNLWSGEMLVSFNLFNNATNYVHGNQFTQQLNVKVKERGYDGFIKDAELNKGYIDDNRRIKLECVVEIKHLDGYSHLPDTNFLEKDPVLSDGTLVVRDKTLYVNKAILANASPFFRSKFFAENRSARTDEIIINDVNYKDFNGMLRVICHENLDIDSTNVETMLDLAKRFQVTVLTVKCMQFILNSQIGIEYKFRLVDQYSLSEVHSACLDNIKTLDQLQRIRGRFGPKVIESLNKKLIDLTPETLD